MRGREDFNQQRAIFTLMTELKMEESVSLLSQMKREGKDYFHITQRELWTRRKLYYS